MDIRKVKKLIELLEESGISEIEISEGEESVRISRYPNPGTVSVQTIAAPAPRPRRKPPRRRERQRPGCGGARRVLARPAGYRADGRHVL